jgi:hypothetical protein
MLDLGCGHTSELEGEAPFTIAQQISPEVEKANPSFKILHRMGRRMRYLSLCTPPVTLDYSHSTVYSNRYRQFLLCWLLGIVFLAIGYSRLWYSVLVLVASLAPFSSSSIMIQFCSSGADNGPCNMMYWCVVYVLVFVGPIKLCGIEKTYLHRTGFWKTARPL